MMIRIANTCSLWRAPLATCATKWSFGGSVAGLLITDPVAEGIRATADVDAIIEATTLGQFHQVEHQSRCRADGQAPVPANGKALYPAAVRQHDVISRRAAAFGPEGAGRLGDTQQLPRRDGFCRHPSWPVQARA